MYRELNGNGSVSAQYRRLFFIDFLGAGLSACLLFFVLRNHVPFFGMPAAVLNWLAAGAALLFVFSFGCFCWSDSQGRRMLRLLAFGNGAYCAATLGLVIGYSDVLTPWGLLYFGLEMAVVAVLVSFELKASAGRMGQAGV